MPRAYQGLLIDVGGVLTGDIFESFDAYLAREGIEGLSFRQLYFDTPHVQELLYRLETGELHHTEAQGPLAEMLHLPPDRADGLFSGLYQALEFVPEMTDAVETLRRTGVRTGVLSNSWWFPMYDRPFYARAFDVQVISGQVGLRKPDPAMFELGLRQLGLAAARVLFVDDFEQNLPPARALGMTTFLHDPADPARTIAEFERCFDVELA